MPSANTLRGFGDLSVSQHVSHHLDNGGCGHGTKQHVTDDLRSIYFFGANCAICDISWG
jgi:hypothetical protein